MKRIRKIFMLLILIMPIFVYALSYTDYDNSIDDVNNYINKYNDRSKYLIFDQKYDFKNHKMENNTQFTKGGLLSKEEYDISTIKGTSYLATGKEYWTLTGAGTNQYYIDATILSKNKGESSGIRVTEFIKNSVRVNGKGTYINPWEFRNEYAVDVKTNSTAYGDVDRKSQMVAPNQPSQDITLTEKPGYMYISNDCGLTKIRTQGNYNTIFRINKVTKDIDCTINLDRRVVLVTYDCNGGTGSVSAQSFKYGDYYILNNSSCVRTGYHQIGWIASSGENWNNVETGTWNSDNGQRGVKNNKLELKAKWEGNELVFPNQTPTSGTYSVSAQTFSITGATNGTGTYTYTEKSEKNSSGTSTNYLSISGTTITAKANTPAGTYTYVITAKDSNSNVTKDATYTITINKKAVTVTAATSSRVYNGSAYTNASCTGNGLLSGHTVTCAMTTASTITNVGNVANTINTVTIKNSGGTAVTTNYNITKVAGTLTVTKANSTAPTLTSKTFTYNGSSQCLTVSGGTSGLTKEFAYRTWNGSAYGNWSTWRTSTNTYCSTNVGQWELKARVVGNDNYNTSAESEPATLIVNKASVTLSCSNKTYNGSEQIGCSCTGGTIAGTYKATNANTYTASCTVDSNHTKPTDKTWTIAKAASTAPTLTAKTFNYNGTSQCLTVSGGTSGLTKEFAYRTWDGSKYGNWSTWRTSTNTYCSTNVGQWEIKARVVGNDNYNTSADSTAAVLKVNKVAATLSCSDKTYTGSEQIGCSCTGGTVGGTYKATNANTYTASCTPDGNHTAPTNVTWKINKASVTLTCANKTYNGSEQTGCSCTGGTIAGTYKATNANTYTASCTVDSNHAKPADKTWTIAKANSTAPTLTAKTFTYNGSSQCLTVSGGTSGLTKQYAYRTWDGSKYGNWSSWSTSTGTYCSTNVGQWEIKARVVGNDNYNTSADSTAVVLKVNKVAATLSCSNKTYTGSAQTACTYSGCSSTSSISGTNAGSYTASCTPDGNHTAPTNVTWTMNKKGVTITAKDQTINQGSSIATGTGQVTTSGLISGHTLSAISLTASTTAVTTSGQITPSAATIKNSGGTAVTSNYSITYNKGKLVINAVDTGPTVKVTAYNYSGNASAPNGSTVLKSSQTFTSDGTYEVDSKWWNKAVAIKMEYSDGVSGVKSVNWVYNNWGSYTDTGDSYPNSGGVTSTGAISDYFNGEGYRKGKLTVTSNSGKVRTIIVVVRVDTTAPTYSYSNDQSKATATCSDNITKASGGKTVNFSGSSTALSGTCKDEAGNTNAYSKTYYYSSSSVCGTYSCKTSNSGCSCGNTCSCGCSGFYDTKMGDYCYHTMTDSECNKVCVQKGTINISDDDGHCMQDAVGYAIYIGPASSYNNNPSDTCDRKPIANNCSCGNGCACYGTCNYTCWH